MAHYFDCIQSNLIGVSDGCLFGEIHHVEIISNQMCGFTKELDLVTILDKVHGKVCIVFPGDLSKNAESGSKSDPGI